MDSIDIDKACGEIRKFKAKGYSDIRIMDETKIPRATFYRYKARMAEQMKEVIALQSKEQIMADIELCKTRLEDCLYRIEETLNAVEENEDGEEASVLTAGQKEAYIARKEEISLNILKLEHETPDLLMKGIEIDHGNNKGNTEQLTNSQEREQVSTI